eukprot:3051773-Pleurochrysis_carterae.AAC.2
MPGSARVFVERRRVLRSRRQFRPAPTSCSWSQARAVQARRSTCQLAKPDARFGRRPSEITRTRDCCSVPTSATAMATSSRTRTPGMGRRTHGYPSRH